MATKLLIVEDEFIVANDLRMMLETEGYDVCGVASSVEEAQDIIHKEKPKIVLLDIYLKGSLTGIDLAQQLSAANIIFVYLSANSNQQVLEAARATQPYGFLVKPFRRKDVLVTLDIARYRHENSQEASLRRELLMQKLLSQIIAEPVEPEQKMLRIARAIQPYIPFDYITGGDYSFLRIGFDEYQTIGIPELQVITGLKETALQAVRSSAQHVTIPLWRNDNDFKKAAQACPFIKLIAHTFHVASDLVVPLTLPNGEHFTFSFFSRRPDAYTAEHLSLLQHLQQSLAMVAGTMEVVEKKRHFRPLSVTAPETSVSPNLAEHFEGIIGSSHHHLNVLDHVIQVAPLDTSVLILGESGTGKEKIAHSIHRVSPRNGKSFIKINCAALPASLIESELFGHEKGAFTGAIEKRIGRFEQAANGTLFLDEIGELPIELQPKLLRVLQEKEIERIGGKTTIHINARIIAATNRNLEQEVAAGRFRLDLYYRLTVFPILLPPLRERVDDILPLARYFATQFSQKFNKAVTGISTQMAEELKAWQWPGNVRELEHIIEQAVILSDGHSPLQLRRPLHNPTSLMHYSAPASTATLAQTLTDVKKIQQQTEKEYLLSVLRKTNGRIRGSNGAAELMKLNPTTLESKMARLGIKKDALFIYTTFPPPGNSENIGD